MSHVARVQLLITDLDALARACAQIGLELRLNQKTFNWFGQWVGDYHAEDAAYRAFDPKTFGTCEHAISIPGTITGKNDGSQPYEIGLVPRADGKPGWEILFDFYAGGHGLMAKIATAETDAKTGRNRMTNANKLKQAYAEQVASAKARSKGFRVLRTVTPAGKVVLRAMR